MTVQIEEIEYCKVRVEYQAEAELVEDKRTEVVEEYKKANLKVPGFRQAGKSPKLKHRGVLKSKKKSKGTRFKPGKKSDPKKVHQTKDYERSLLNLYGPQIDKRVTSELISEGYDEALFETRLKPIGFPEVSNINLTQDGFSCEMLFAKKPDFELGQYKGFEIPEPAFDKTTTQLVEESLQEMRVNYADSVTYTDEDFVQAGDSITMTVVAMAGEEKIEELSQEGLFYQVGSVGSNVDFDSNLSGMKAGETKSFIVNFGDDAHLNDVVKNKSVSFEVTVHMGVKKVLCPLDDTLAQKISEVSAEKFENLNDLTIQLTAAINNQRKENRLQKIREQVINRLLESNEFEVPSWLVTAESQRTAVQFQRDWNELSSDEINFLNEASTKKVKLSLILDSIRDSEPEASFSETELINNFLKHLKNQGVEKPNQVLSKMKSNGTLFSTIAHLMDESTIQWLIDNSTIVE